MPRQVIVALASEAQQAILCAALAAQGLPVSGLPLSAHLETAVMQAMRDREPPLLLIDIAMLAQLATGADQFCEWKRHHCASADLLLFCSELHAVHDRARLWAQQLGALDLLPGCDLSHYRESLLPTIRTILSLLGTDGADEAAMARALQELSGSIDDTSPVAQAWRRIDTLRTFGGGLQPGALIAKMLGGGIDIRAHTYRMKTYEECFVGHQAVDWLAQTVDITRADAACIGQALLELGCIYHVAHEQPFQDKPFFYRVRADTPRLNALNLQTVALRLREGGVTIRNRKFHGVIYPACFIGADATAWMRTAFELGENEAMTLGQRLVDLFMVHHVVDRQPYRNGRFFYRYYQDER